MLALLDSSKQTTTATNPSPVPPQRQAESQPDAVQPTATGAGTPSSQLQQSALVGTWTAQPDNKTSIKLMLQPDGKFTWDVAKSNGQNQLHGNYMVASGDQLPLAQDQQGGTLAGSVAIVNNGRFTFRLTGAPASDPGLTFVRQL